MTPILVIYLLVAFTIKHFVFDFLYQPPYQWMNKGDYGHWGGLVHSLQHAIPTYFILWSLGVNPTTAMMLAMSEFLIHYHIDWAKMNINKKMGWGATTHNEFWILLGVDQLLHSLTYLWIAYEVLK